MVRVVIEIRRIHLSTIKHYRIKNSGVIQITVIRRVIIFGDEVVSEEIQIYDHNI